MHCPQCQAQIQLPAPPWSSQWPPYVCGGCGAHWGARYHSEPFLIPPDVKPLWPLMSWQQAAKWVPGNGDRPYVYALTYPNGLPFYVGKGRRHRLIQHAAYLRLTSLWADVRRPHDEKEAVIRALALNRDYERYAILAICDSDSEAFAIEAAAIKRYGRREAGGMLCNATIASDADAWPMPDPPMYDVISDGEWSTNYHPALNPRAVKRGQVQWCPKCDSPSMCLNQTPTPDLRCPICFHYFELVDEAKLRKWLPPGFVTENCELCQPIPN